MLNNLNIKTIRTVPLREKGEVTQHKFHKKKNTISKTFKDEDEVSSRNTFSILNSRIRTKDILGNRERCW
jgi:hypothetical protein